jgi:hypothetical protein
MLLTPYTLSLPGTGVGSPESCPTDRAPVAAKLMAKSRIHAARYNSICNARVGLVKPAKSTRSAACRSEWRRGLGLAPSGARQNGCYASVLEACPMI